MIKSISLRMTIGKKIAGGFIVVIALVFFMSMFTYFKVGQLHTSSQETLKQSLAKIQLAEELAIDVANEAVAMRRFNFTGDLSDAAAFNDHRNFGNNRIKQLEASLTSANSIAILKDLKKEKAAFDTLAEKSIAAKRADNISLVGLTMQQAGKPSENSIAATKQLVLAVKEQIRDEAEMSAKQAGQVQLLLIIVSFLIASVSVLVSVYTIRGISKPLRSIAFAAKEIADGNLATPAICLKSSDELGQLAHIFNQMKLDLQDIIQRVFHSAEQVAASSEQLSTSADQSAQAGNQVAGASANVAQSAALQIATVNDTMFAVKKMSASIQQIAANASTVENKSAQAAEAASVGSQAVEKAIQQMGQLEHSVNTSASVVAKLGEQSREIGQIVETISGIAGQTNLLALNAAIEAARAGEQGRGFSVVAEEVRKLAEQSQAAAKKIAELIGQIQGDTDKAVAAMIHETNDVGTGVKMVNDAGKAFLAIQSVVLEVSSQTKEIAGAINELASGSETVVASIQAIESVGRRVSEETQTVSAVTEEQSASVEEIAASSQTLARMAQDLQSVVNRFRF